MSNVRYFITLHTHISAELIRCLLLSCVKCTQMAVQWNLQFYNTEMYSLLKKHSLLYKL